jgi:hypothetical protein
LIGKGILLSLVIAIIGKSSRMIHGCVNKRSSFHFQWFIRLHVIDVPFLKHFKSMEIGLHQKKENGRQQQQM